MGRRPKDDTYESKDGVSTICAVCGKTFVPAPYHRYHGYGVNGHKRVCTYTCMLKDERRHKEALQKKSRSPKKK